ncbi:MAG: DNA double-strand break repair protein Mre11 [Halodesulfurarchaeum sp.]
MTRVVHTGDTHLGYRQYHLRERREDFIEAFRQVIEDAIAADVDAVVHAGDLFDDRRPGLASLRETIDVLETLRRAEIPFLAVVGNHEDARDGQWIDLFEQLDLAIHLGREATIVSETAFYGLDFVPRSRREGLEYAFEPSGAEHAALVAHGLFEPFPHGDWDLEAVLSQSPVDFDAVLLGDDHTPDRKQVAGTWATYCGSTERASADERDPRGYNIVEFDDGVSITRRDLNIRPFVFIDVELEAGEGEDLLAERLRETDLTDAVVIVTIEGEGDPIQPAEIEAIGESEGALTTRVTDRREFETTSAAVSFADPEDAVDQRIRELGLSDVARSIEGLIREDEIPKTNLRGRVTDSVEDRLDEPEAFHRVAAPDQEPSPKLGSDDSDAELQFARGETEADDGSSERHEPADEDEPEDENGRADEDEPEDENGRADEDEPEDENGRADEDEPDETDDEGPETNESAGRNATMEEFL